jgi:hypothetical protein
LLLSNVMRRAGALRCSSGCPNSSAFLEDK